MRIIEWAGGDGVGRVAPTGSISRSPISRKVGRTEALWVKGSMSEIWAPVKNYGHLGLWRCLGDRR